MNRLTRGLVAAALCSGLLAVPASAATVTATVRVEGQNQTLLPTTTVTLDPSATVHLADADCPGNSVAAALDQATHGNWDRSKFPQTILGETHAFADSDYWAEWVNERYAQVGICDQLLSTGDRVLELVDRTPPPDYASTVFPIALSGLPANAQQGAPVTATVVQDAADGTPSPLAGATVAGGGASAVTDAAGHATLAFTQTGTVTVRAVKDSERSDVATLCVTNGADGLCGAPGSGTASSPSTSSGSVAVRDTTPPLASIAGLRDGTRFRHGHGPRLLKGAVAEAGGVLMVKLRLERRFRGRCSYFSGRFERFRGARCATPHREWFRIGDSTTWSYLLPKRLPKGSYTLDVNAIDRAYNRDDARRAGANEVHFVVR